MSSLPGLRRSGVLPRRLSRRGGASVVRHNAVMNRMEIPMRKPAKKPAKTRTSKSKRVRATSGKACAPC